MTLNIPKPNEKQQQFLRSKTRFTAYGGARGGGKSWALRVKALLLALRYPGIKILILRRTLVELRENHIIPLREMSKGIAAWRELEKTLVFPNGSRIIFGYCASDNDVLQYQGNEYSIIMVDEATQISEYQWSKIYPSCRGADNFPHRIYLTCNPGGIGHAWVKRLFVDRQYFEGESEEDYTFVKATVYDNPALLEQDPDYVHMLETLPEDIRRAWLDGDWDVFDGQFFSEFRRDVHACEPFEIPKGWTRYVTMDYGLDMTAAYWIAIAPDGMAYAYKEFYQSGLIASDAAEKIKEYSEGESIYDYIAPPDLWNRRNDTGRSVAEIFGENGIYLTKANNDRVNGWMDMKEWLKPLKLKTDDGESVVARLRFFNTCRNLISNLPLLQFDPKRPNDAANDPHEITHAPDAIRYFCAGRPCVEYKQEKKKSTLPFALQDEEKVEGFLW